MAQDAPASTANRFPHCLAANATTCRLARGRKRCRAARSRDCGSTPREYHHQAVDTPALRQVLVDDLVDVLGRLRPIPDAVGVDDHQRTGGTEAETARCRESDI